MSAPARQVRARQAPQPEPRRARTSPSPGPATPGRARTAVPAKRTLLRLVPVTGRRSATRSRSGARFWIVSTVVVGAMVFGLAGVYAMLAQGAFEMDALATRQEGLARSNEGLQLQVERRSTSGEIASWAAKNHMILPDRIEIISVPAARVHDGPSRDLVAPPP